MSNISDLLRLLQSLEDRLDNRIDALEKKNERLVRNKRILTRALHEDVDGDEGLNKQQGQSHFPTGTTSKGNGISGKTEDDVNAVLPDKLDEILSLAKNIRGIDDSASVGTSSSSVNTASTVRTSNSSKVSGKTVSFKVEQSGKGKVSTISGKPAATSSKPTSIKGGTTKSVKPVTLNNALKQPQEIDGNQGVPSSSQSKKSLKAANESSINDNESVSTKSSIPPVPLSTLIQPPQEGIPLSENGTNGEEDTEKTPQTVTYKQQVYQQLQLMNRQRFLSRFKPAYSLSNRLYQVQSNILLNSMQNITNILPIPSSILLDALSLLQYGLTRHHIQLKGNPAGLLQSSNRDSESERMTDDIAIVHQFIEKLGQEMSLLVNVISKSPASKVATLPSSHFNTEQCGEFVDLWYRSRILIEIFASLLNATIGKTNDYMKRRIPNSGNIDEEKVSSTLRSIFETIACPMILGIPLDMDDLTIERNKFNNRGTKWLTKELLIIRDRNIALQSQVSFWMEKYIAKTVVPIMIQELKNCVKLSQGMGSNDTTPKKINTPRTPVQGQRVNDPGHQTLRARWINILKCYQVLHSLLVSRGKDHSSCVFIDR